MSRFHLLQNYMTNHRWHFFIRGKTSIEHINSKIRQMVRTAKSKLSCAMVDNGVFVTLAGWTGWIRVKLQRYYDSKYLLKIQRKQTIWWIDPNYRSIECVSLYFTMSLLVKICYYFSTIYPGTKSYNQFLTLNISGFSEYQFLTLNISGFSETSPVRPYHQVVSDNGCRVQLKA